VFLLSIAIRNLEIQWNNFAVTFTCGKKEKEICHYLGTLISAATYENVYSKTYTSWPKFFFPTTRFSELKFVRWLARDFKHDFWLQVFRIKTEIPAYIF
jgi:hypothetical protein